MVVVHGQVHAAAGDAGLVREDGQRGLVLAVVPPVGARRTDPNVAGPTQTKGGQPPSRTMLQVHPDAQISREAANKLGWLVNSPAQRYEMDNQHFAEMFWVRPSQSA